jgi:hypothetical protein
MGEQLAIEVKVVNKNGYDTAKAEFDADIRNRDLHPVFLIFNTDKKVYFVSRMFSKEFITSTYKHYKILE